MSNNSKKKNNSNSSSNIRPFGIKDKLGYMLGDLGNDFTFIFASAFLMVFYTKVFGISGAIVGTLFLVARCIDAFADLAMGRIVDSVKPTKNGRFRPWLQRMCIPVALASVLMFLFFVKDWTYSAKVIYMSVTYLIWGICYSGINIPYGSMASVISPEAGDRSSLSTFRTLGSTLASLTIGVITPLIIYTTDTSGNQVVVPKNFTMIAIVFSILAVVCYVLCFKLCKERVKIEKQVTGEKENVSKMFKGLLANRALLAIIGAALMLLLASLLSQTMNAYLFMDYFHNAKLLSVVSLISVGGILLVAPFASKISKKYGKKEAGSISVLIAGMLYVIMFFLKIKSIVLFVSFMFAATIGMGFFNMIIWALITDVIDYQEVLNNKREDGTVYAVYSFARKLGQAIAGGIGGFALTAIGYVSNATTQTTEVTNGVYTISTIVPGICYLAVFAIMFFAYPLTKKKVEENTIELKRRRDEMA